MGHRLHRLIGLLVALSGAALLGFLAEALYTPSEHWLRVLVAISLPAMLLLTMAGAGLLGGGLWLLLHSDPPDARA